MDADTWIARLPGVRWIPMASSLAFLVATLVAVRVGSGSILQRSVAALLPTLFALRLAAHARDLDAGNDLDDVRTILGWILGGVTVMALIAFWFGFTDAVLGLTIPPSFAALTLLAGGALLGILVGRYSVRARQQVRATTEARVERELTRRQQERIALLNRTLGHHTRNAVTVIALNAELLESRVDDDATEYAETIRDRGLELSDTVDVIQDVAETLTETGDLRERDVAAVVRSRVARARDQYPDAEFEVDRIPETAHVRADDWLDRVVDAQLDNAVEHSDRATPTVRVGVDPGPSTVQLRVADDGPGIPDEEKPLVFEAGDRGQTTAGDGLELFLADAIVERYGGEITIEDNDPRGAVFLTTLPKPDADRAPPDDLEREIDTNPAILGR